MDDNVGVGGTGIVLTTKVHINIIILKLTFGWGHCLYMECIQFLLIYIFTLRMYTYYMRYSAVQKLPGEGYGWEIKLKQKEIKQI